MRKHPVRHRQTLPKSLPINTHVRFHFFKKGQQILGSHVAGQIVFGHRTATKTAQSPIETSATMLPRGLYFFPPTCGCVCRCAPNSMFG